MSFMPRSATWTRRYASDEDFLARFDVELPRQQTLEAALRVSHGRSGHRDILNATRNVSEFQATLLLDHGLQAIASLDARIAEAITAAGLLEAEGDYFNRKVRRRAGQSPHPPKDTPADEATFLHLDGLAISACVSACSGAFDRLAAGAAFVLGLDVRHRRADWGRLVGGRWAKDANRWARGHLQEVSTVTADAPWWTYLKDLRNVLAHRPPTLTVAVMQPTAGNPLVLTLPRKPRSVLGELLLEAEKNEISASYLSEPAHVTLMGLARECAAAIDNACGILSEAWTQGRDDPSLARATPLQFHDGGIEEAFEGFDPQDDFFDIATTLAVNPRDGRRLETFQRSSRSSGA